MFVKRTIAIALVLASVAPCGFLLRCKDVASSQDQEAPQITVNIYSTEAELVTEPDTKSDVEEETKVPAIELELPPISSTFAKKKLPIKVQSSYEEKKAVEHALLNSNNVNWYSSFKPEVLNKKTTICGGHEIDIDFFAKLLYAEAGSMCWEGQVYVASAILNLCDRIQLSVYEAGHITRRFSVAPYVDYVTPLPKQYEVIEYVLNGGRVLDIQAFRTNYYHGFGTPVCYIQNVYFSK